MGTVVEPIRVLCVDDNVDAATSCAEFLSLMGFDARAVFGPLEALAVAEAFHPHACLLDINMPQMSGYELAPRLRELVGPVFLIAVTAAAGEEHRRRLKLAAFDLALTKPADPWAFVEPITRHVALPRLEQDEI